MCSAVFVNAAWCGGRGTHLAIPVVMAGTNGIRSTLSHEGSGSEPWRSAHSRNRIRTGLSTSVRSIVSLRSREMKSVLLRFVREDAGQDLIEYALLATLVALAVVVGAGLLGTNLNSWYNNLGTRVGTWATTAGS